VILPLWHLNTSQYMLDVHAIGLSLEAVNCSFAEVGMVRVFVSENLLNQCGGVGNFLNFSYG
jgi:hypothetical protein